ncbi:uncharacterized protein LOC135377724 [Ornithodoros turicata]|uniref:uncharacterized protein LOC135377724 n=1 Tax=Ornithodoros turicata TaxID=34597 RepID=UPI00313913CB
MDKEQEAAMAHLDYATGEMSRSATLTRDLLPPPAYKRPMSDKLKMSVVLASALVAISVVIGIVIVLSVHIRSQNCACQDGNKLEAVDLPALGSNTVPSKIPIPMKLQMDPLAGQMLRKNQRAQVSCVVEKKRASEVIAHEPKMIMTPFGNMTSEPRMVHLSGERMIFSCLTGPRDETSKNIRGISRNKRGIASEEKDCACDCNC